MADDTAQQRLKPEEIRFLALEGGGGKGFAYLGAIQVLEQKKVMERLEGISGTSAGAITALMLSLGMSSSDIEKELTTTDFNTFFDPPTNSTGRLVVPSPGKYLERSATECEKALLSYSDPIKAYQCLLSLNNFFAKIVTGVARILKGSGPSPFNLATVFQAYINHLLSDAGPELAPLKPVLEQLNSSLPEYLVYLDSDMGFFSGQAARNYFEGLIQRQLKSKLGKDAASKIQNLNFYQYKVLKKVLGARDLLVCGANLSSGSSVLFSWKHTPNFPIADAVRISMSLPIAYKPYIIDDAIQGYPPCGTYIDGGIWNNLPFREIAALSTAGSKKKQPAPAPQEERRPLAEALAQRNTLGLRLEIVPPVPVLNAQELLLKTFAVAGETQILPDLDPYIQILDTRDLHTLQFSPPGPVRDKVSKRSRRAMYRYFGESPPKEDADEQDDKATEELRSKSLCQSRSGASDALLQKLMSGNRWTPF